MKWKKAVGRVALAFTGLVFLYLAFLQHHWLYDASLQAAGVLVLALIGFVLFHEALHPGVSADEEG